MRFGLFSLLLFAGLNALAQSPSPGDNAPVYRVSSVPRPTTVLAYRDAKPMRVDFSGTWLLPRAHGQATVTSESGNLHIEAEIDGLSSAAHIGPAYLTYVLWALNSGGQFTNLGEVAVTGTTGRVAATTDIQAFALIVTAEPYFAVTEPSNAVILRNTAGDSTLQYKLAPDLLPLLMDDKTPLDLFQARNAVRIARRLGAERLAPLALDRAVELLSQAENGYRKDDLFVTVYKAREATLAAEEARVIAARKQSE